MEGERGEGPSLREEIYDTIARLNHERMALEQESRFTDAGRVKARLELLGEEFVKVSLNALRERQQQERHDFEARYEADLEEIQSTFDADLQEKERQMQEKIIELQDAQAAQLRELHAQLRGGEGQEGRATPEMLNMDYQIKRLVRDQRYTEAGLLQKTFEKVRAKAQQRNSEMVEGRARNLLDKAMREHTIEISALETKLLSERDSLIKQRDRAVEIAHSKYRVFYEKMLKGHQTDIVGEERSLKKFNPCSNNFVSGK